MKRLAILLALLLTLAPGHVFADTERGDRGAEVTEVQTLLKGYGYTVVVDGTFGAQTEKAVRSWQKSNGLLVDGIVGPATLASLRAAKRLNNATQVTPTLPPPMTTGLNGLPFAPAGLSNCAEMSFYRQQAGLPEKFDALGWRESNCRNEDGVHTSCCWGYWQLHQNHVRSGYAKRWREECQIDSYQDFNSDNAIDKQRQACGAFVLYDMSGYSPWAA
jgi:peptidoglycan hydrolase-like protein with peptidoglycan-binding domain